MEITIERRKVCADPADEDDVLWIFEQFEREDAWRTFGYAGPAMAEAMFSYVTRDMVLSVIRRAGIAERVGFVVLFPPHEGGRAWELGYVIEPAHRDAFTAIRAIDAVSFAMFERMGCEAIGFRVRDENAASLAVIRRLGYTPRAIERSSEGVFHHYEVDRARWRERLERLERSAAERGDGPAFLERARPELRRWRPYRARAA